MTKFSYNFPQLNKIIHKFCLIEVEGHAGSQMGTGNHYSCCLDEISTAVERAWTSGASSFLVLMDNADLC